MAKRRLLDDVSYGKDVGKPGEPITLQEGEALQDIIIQYEHRAATALHAHQYDKAIQCGRHIMNIVNRIYGKTHPLCIYGGVILGEAYFLKGDLDKAKKYLLAAEKRLEYVDDKKSAQTLRCAIACYIKLGDLFFQESKKSTSVKDTLKKHENRRSDQSKKYGLRCGCLQARSTYVR